MEPRSNGSTALISPDLEYSTSEEGYMVRIPYTYVFVSKDGREERGAKRLILTWKQVHAGWKITKIEEKSFPLWPADIGRK